MVALPEKPAVATIERDARSLWASQRLPPLEGPLGPPEGPVVRQFLGAFAPQESGMLVAQRAVAADVDARALALAGRRARGILRKEDGGPPVSAPKIEPVLGALGVWVGGTDGQPWDAVPRRPEVETLVGRLAHMGALAVRDVSLRICPACASARSPERIVYEEADGETLLVRFAFPDGDRTVSALVWTDAPWRLLGTSALMVHPDLPYVVARYRRKGVDELVFTSKSSIERLRGWLPGAEIETLEEHPGRHWEGRAYVHPLRHEFPMGGSLEPPGGTIVPVSDVSDSGTGVVPLVPGHGGTDTQIADRLRVPGWPLVTPKGRLDLLFVHKYAGLELESGNEFVERDLDEEGAIFARLRVRRGVPHCMRCGTPVIWAPGRAWCLEPSRLPAEKLALYRALLPGERAIAQLEPVPWPASEPQRSDDALSIALLECTGCDRLDSLEQPTERCVCGARRRAVRRRLLPAFDAAVSAWASADPFSAADSARLYVSSRRRAPAVVHQVAAMSGVAGIVAEVRITVLPTVPEADLLALAASYGADAVRSALVRAQGSEGETATFAERCVQETRRLEALWKTAAEILAPVDTASLANFAAPIGGALGDLEPEDRALLARFERMRIQALVDFERSSPELVHRHLFRFLENDLATYRAWVAPRLAEPGNGPSKRAALHTLVHTLFHAVLLLGPIAPHRAEAIHRALRRGRMSVFQEPPVGVDRALLDPARVTAWDRWTEVVGAIDRGRRAHGLAPATTIPSVALIVESDAVANDLRAEAPTLERLSRVGKIEVGSPGSPWSGRRRQLRPRESEIQRVYSSRAAQIIHLLKRLPERKSTDPSAGGGFTILVNGQPTQILPSMFAWEETLPERFVPCDWRGGELYVELPATAALPPAPLPPLSPDALRLVVRIRHGLGRVRTGPSPAVVVAASGPLAAELAPVAGALAKHLGVAEFRVVTSDRELPRHGREDGRTKAGTAWSFHVTDRTFARRPPKHRAPRPHGSRVRPAFAPGELAPTVRDYSDAEWIGREAAVRALGQELDQLLGTPVLGPSKVAAAWDAGFRDVESFRGAPFDALVALPGFGFPVAAALVTRLGGSVPPRPPRYAHRVLPHDSSDGSNGGAGSGSQPTSPVLAAERSPGAPPPTLAVSAPKAADIVAAPTAAPVRPTPTARTVPAAPPSARPRETSPDTASASPTSRAPAAPPAALPSTAAPAEPPGVPSPDTPEVSGPSPEPPATEEAPAPPGPVADPEVLAAIGGPTVPSEVVPMESSPERIYPSSTETPTPGDAPTAEAIPAGPLTPPDTLGPDPPTPSAVAPPEPASPTPSVAVRPVNPPVAVAPAAPPPTPPPAAGIEILVGSSYVPALERFLEATAAGHQGICVVRDSPERVRAYIGSRPVEIRWLTNIGRGPTLKPTDLDGLSAFLEHAASSGHVTAFFLEGVEYLVRLHGLDRVVERMAAFDRLAREHAARLWLPLNPKLLSPVELERFVAAFGGGSGAN